MEQAGFPDKIHLGASVVLGSLETVAHDLGMGLESVEELLAVLKIPTIRLPGNPTRYVSLYPLEFLLFEAGLPEAMKGSQNRVEMHHLNAGIIYGAVRIEAIKKRLRSIGAALRRGDRLKARDLRSRPGRKRCRKKG